MNHASTQSFTGVEGRRIAEFKGDFAHPQKLPRVHRESAGHWSWNHVFKDGVSISGLAASRREACNARRLAMGCP